MTRRLSRQAALVVAAVPVERAAAVAVVPEAPAVVVGAAKVAPTILMGMAVPEAAVVPEAEPEERAAQDTPEAAAVTVAAPWRSLRSVG